MVGSGPCQIYAVQNRFVSSISKISICLYWIRENTFLFNMHIILGILLFNPWIMAQNYPISSDSSVDSNKTPKISNQNTGELISIPIEFEISRPSTRRRTPNAPEIAPTISPQKLERQILKKKALKAYVDVLESNSSGDLKEELAVQTYLQVLRGTQPERQALPNQASTTAYPMPKPPPPNQMALADYGAQPQRIEQSIARKVSRINIQSSGEPRAGGASNS